MQKIITNLWFDHNAQEAVDFYCSVFKNSRINTKTYYPQEGLHDFQQEFAGKLLTIEFEMLGQVFVAINAGPEFKFNESISLQINCINQEEIDYYWELLTQDGRQESQCGWCKDKFGLSWQICPLDLGDRLLSSTAWSAMMSMKKIILKDLV